MQTDNRFLDDFARLASSLLGVASGMRGEAEAVFKARLQAIFADMDLVPRDEFDAVKAMAAKARAEQETLETRVAALEAALAGKSGAKAAPKSAAKSSTRSGVKSGTKSGARPARKPRAGRQQAK